MVLKKADKKGSDETRQSEQSERRERSEQTGRSEQPPVQHTPKHLEGDVFDRRHPAASPFAPAQPAAGVVADDVEERGQNLAGGEKASDAAGTFSDQKEVLAEQHEANIRAAAAPPGAMKVEGGKATPDTRADDAKADTESGGDVESTDKPSTDKPPTDKPPVMPSSRK